MPKTADPTLTTDASDLYDALSNLIRVYQFRDRDRICCHDLSVTQCYAIESLATNPLTVNELSASLYLDKSTTSRVVNALERKGYVKRTVHPDDGRALLLEMTRRGRDLYEKIRSEIVHQERELIAEFDHDTRQALITMVQRLAKAAARCVDTSGGSCCAVTPEREAG